MLGDSDGFKGSELGQTDEDRSAAGDAEGSEQDGAEEEEDVVESLPVEVMVGGWGPRGPG